jgi:hypothetical protein
MTPEQLARAEEWLRNPPPGSKAAAAKEYGVDLTLLIEQLRRTPEERLRQLQLATTQLEELRASTRKHG